ncbi:MAG TPA: maleylpyruvate isomerase family mycothiol-dependent enzyme [Acidimicrobiales bacterium]
MMTTTVAVEGIEPITTAEARALATTEYARLADLLRSLSPQEWILPTDCPEWDVRSMAGHCVGMATDFTSFGRLVRSQVASMRAARRNGTEPIDEMTAQQVGAHASLDTAELIHRLEQVGPAAASWRTSVPALLRKLQIPETVGGETEKWPMSYLLDVILTRDPWMHRVDITQVTDHEMVLTPEHDGRIVADVVGEWARRHGRSFTLTLTGPIGATYVAGDGTGEDLTLDTVEFCRILSGRAHGPGLLTQEVPF